MTSSLLIEYSRRVERCLPGRWFGRSGRFRVTIFRVNDSMPVLPRLATILLWAAAGFAAEPVPFAPSDQPARVHPDRFTKPGFGCVDARMDFQLEDPKDPALEFQRRSPRDLPKDLPAPLFTARFEGRAASITNVAFYVLTPAEGPPARPRFLARTSERTKSRAARNVRWWELVVRAGKRTDEIGFLAPLVPYRFGATWAIDDKTPLLRATRLASSGGMNTVYSYEDHLLLDFRETPPSVRAALRCESAEGGGACGAPDRGWSGEGTVGCSWVSQQSDFLCEATSDLPYPWVMRHFRSRFLLFADRGVPDPSARPAPKNVREFAEWAETDSDWRGRSVDLPEGTVRHIARIPLAPSPAAILHLFAAPRASEEFRHRFFLAILESGQTVEKEIEPKQDLEEPTVEPSVPEEDQGGDKIDPSEVNVGRTYDVRTIVDDGPGFRLLRVVASEGIGRAIYWIGLGRDEKGWTADLLPVANASAAYDRCNRFRHPASVVDVVVRKAPFEARLLVEPSWADGNIYPLETTDPKSLCLEWRRLTWVGGEGFSLSVRGAECAEKTAPFHVEITEGGDIRRVQSAYWHEFPK
jgi:hypothetical protein